MYQYHLNQGKTVLVEKACEHCGEFFMPVRAYHIYCKPSCKKAHLMIAYKIGVDIKEMNALKDPLDEEIKRNEEAKGIAALKPPPGFVEEKSVSRIEYSDDIPEEDKVPCVRCNSRKAISPKDLYCLECEKQIEQEENLK